MFQSGNELMRIILDIYSDADNEMSRVPKVCKNKCSHCCHQNVRLHIAESIVAENYIREKMPDDIKKIVATNLHNWFRYFDNVTPTGRILEDSDIAEFDRRMAADHVACPMLDDGSCAIYGARPLACRTFSVNDSPLWCERNPMRPYSPDGQRILKRMFDRMCRQSRMAGTRILGYALQESLGLYYKCKPIKMGSSTF